MTLDEDVVLRAARACHEANRALCIAFGDYSQEHWDDAAEWQRESIIQGVRLLRQQPETTPAGLHEAWCFNKRAQGWIYGPIKDADTKTHPCLVPHEELPPEQRAKDFVIQAVAREILGLPHLS